MTTQRQILLIGGPFDGRLMPCSFRSDSVVVLSDPTGGNAVEAEKCLQASLYSRLVGGNHLDVFVFSETDRSEALDLLIAAASEALSRVKEEVKAATEERDG